MIDYVRTGRLQVAKVLADFVDADVLPGTGVDPAAFWSGLEQAIEALVPRNRALLAKRDVLQADIDAWHKARRGQPHDPAAYRAFLESIGYLVTEGADFAIDTENVDDEIATMAGPQLVTPISNARFAVNAANARWGSLYDALYGTDVVPDAGGAGRSASAVGGGLNPVRVAHVAAAGKALPRRDHPDREPQWPDPARTGGRLYGRSRRAPRRCRRGRSTRLPFRPQPVPRLSGRSEQTERDPARAQRPRHRDPPRQGASGRQHRQGRRL